jgi:hypothetical protein
MRLFLAGSPEKSARQAAAEGEPKGRLDNKRTAVLAQKGL